MQNVTRCSSFQQKKRPNRRIVGAFRLSWFVVLICVVVVLDANTIQGQSTTSSPKVPPPEENLDHLSDEELESICTTRGFQLLREDDNGLPYAFTHEDYVEAASRCLDMEREMNEILEQNPELAVELEEEINRMVEEKEHLEKEQQDIKAQQEELLDRSSGASDKEKGSDSNNAQTSSRAFGLGGSKIEIDKKGNDTTEDQGVIDLDSPDGDENSVSSKKGAFKEEVKSTDASSGIASNQTLESNQNVNQTESQSKSIAEIPANVTIPLSVQEVLIESFAQLKKAMLKDFESVFTVMLPLLNTMKEVKNSAIKYLRLLLNYAQTTISEYQQKSNNSQKTDESADKDNKNRQQSAAETSAA